MDNLNFIEIYFRIFLYKIIIPEKAWIIQKRDKNLRIWVKAHLGARATQENLKGESKTHSNTKVRLVPKSTIQHFWSAEQYFKRAELHP